MSKSYRIIVRDYVWASIQGVDPDTWNEVVKQMSFYEDGYEYKIVKGGDWDGRIRFAFPNGSTYLRLLRRVMAILSSMGYTEYKMVNMLKDVGVSIDPIDQNYLLETYGACGVDRILRPYQVEAVNTAIKRGSGILDMATGAGKTTVCGVLCSLYVEQSISCLVVVPGIVLLDQTAADFQSIGVKCGRLGDGYDEVEGNMVVVATWTTLKNQPELMRRFGMIIWDEFHSGAAKEAQKLLNEYGKHIRYRFGCTGTIPKQEVNQLRLFASVGSVLFKITARQLIDAGYLSELRIQPIRLLEYGTDVALPHLAVRHEMRMMTDDMRRDVAKANYRNEVKFMGSDFSRLQAIAGVVATLRKRHGNILVLVTDITMGKRLTQLVDGSVFLYGENKTKERIEQFDRYEREDDVCTIANIKIASTGISINRIKAVVLVDCVKAFTTVIQAIGRGLRKGRDKNFVDVYDVHGDLPSAIKHFKERAEYYYEADYPCSKVQTLKVTYAEPPVVVKKERKTKAKAKASATIKKATQVEMMADLDLDDL
jgi:superfamily II DNA or RNA helicase